MDQSYEKFYKVKNALRVLSSKVNKYEKERYVKGYDAEETADEYRQMLEAFSDFFDITSSLRDE